MMKRPGIPRLTPLSMIDERHASRRTRHAELLILCARFGFNP